MSIIYCLLSGCVDVRFVNQVVKTCQHFLISSFPISLLLSFSFSISPHPPRMICLSRFFFLFVSQREDFVKSLYCHVWYLYVQQLSIGMVARIYNVLHVYILRLITIDLTWSCQILYWCCLAQGTWEISFVLAKRVGQGEVIRFRHLTWRLLWLAVESWFGSSHHVGLYDVLHVSCVWCWHVVGYCCMNNDLHHTDL